MIAPLKPPQPRPSSSNPQMKLAHRVVAQSLLPARPKRSTAPGIASWKAILCVVWMAVVAVCYVARLLGIGS